MVANAVQPEEVLAARVLSHVLGVQVAHADVNGESDLAFLADGHIRAAVERLAAAFPDRRVLAMSEGADEFSTSLGWNRYDYWDGPIQYRPLFVQP